MKKALSLFLTLGILMSCSFLTMGAVHKFDDVGATTHGWYMMEAHPAYLSANVSNSDEITVLDGEYYQNDHTFISGLFANDSMENFEYTELYLQGSYLFKNSNFFCGGYINTISFNNYSDTEVGISPGYLFRLQGKNRASVSINLDSDGFRGIDLDGLFYIDRVKFFGQLVLPKKRNDDGFANIAINMSGRMQVTKELVLGADLDNTDSCLVYLPHRRIRSFGFETAGNDDFNFLLGGTWKPEQMKELVCDLQVGQAGDSMLFNVNGLYQIAPFGVGLQITKIEDLNMLLTLRGSYQIDKYSKAVLTITPKVEDAPSVITASYEMFLK